MPLDRLCSLAVAALIVVLGVADGIAASLPGVKAQKAVVKCQKAIAQAGVKLTTSRLKGLHTCTMSPSEQAAKRPQKTPINSAVEDVVLG